MVLEPDQGSRSHERDAIESILFVEDLKQVLLDGSEVEICFC